MMSLEDGSLDIALLDIKKNKKLLAMVKEEYLEMDPCIYIRI